MASAIVHLLALSLPMLRSDLVFHPLGSSPPGTRDLVPNFSDIAMAVVDVSEVSPGAAGPEAGLLADAETENAQPGLDVESPSTAPGGEHAGSYPGPRPGGDEHERSEGFFPAVPRYVVPPLLDDHDVESISLVIRILVGVNGDAQAVELPDSVSGHNLRQRIVEAAKRFRFQPASKNGTPVASWLEVPLTLRSSP